jgi:hypothetical protein
MRWENNHEWWVGKDLEGGGCGLFQGTILAFVWRERERKIMKSLSQDSW